MALEWGNVTDIQIALFSQHIVGYWPVYMAIYAPDLCPFGVTYFFLKLFEQKYMYRQSQLSGAYKVDLFS